MAWQELELRHILDWAILSLQSGFSRWFCLREGLRAALAKRLAQGVQENAGARLLDLCWPVECELHVPGLPRQVRIGLLVGTSSCCMSERPLIQLSYL